MTLLRTGFPVTMIWVPAPTLPLKASMATGSDTQTLLTLWAELLLASPGTEFCSWTSVGILWRTQQLMSGISM